MVSRTAATLCLLLIIQHVRAQVTCPATGEELKPNDACQSSTFDGTSFGSGDYSGVLLDASTFIDTAADGASFAEASLPAVIFRGANDWVGVDLSSASMPGYMVPGSVFFRGGCTLNGALMGGARTSGPVTFRNSDAVGAELGGSIMSEVLIEGCNFEGSSVDGSKFQNLTILRSRFTDTLLNGIDARGSTLTDVNARRANWTGASFPESVFTRVAADNGLFSGTNFNGATFEDCSFTGVSLSGTSFRGATFRGSIVNTNFDGADLRGADFSGADARGSSFKGARLEGANFNNVDVTGSDFSGASLDESTSFNGAEGTEMVPGLPEDLDTSEPTPSPTPEPATESPEPSTATPTPVPTSATETPTESGTPEPSGSSTPSPDVDERDGDDDDEEDDGSVCFPASGTVQLEDGRTKTMGELSIGDRVLSSSGAFSEVHFFSHRLTEGYYPFIEISTASGSAITMTRNHYLVANGGLVAAKSVKPGDFVVLGSGLSDTVIATRAVVARGLYNPHTIDGYVVVDGLLTSCYTTTVNPSLAHALLAPLRFLYNVGVTAPGLLDQDAPLLAARVPSGATFAN